jgi:chromosome segregation ATPase
MNRYSDEELMQMEYNAMKDERDSWRRNFEELKIKYKELQEVFVETDDELNIYRDKFIEASLQSEYLENDYEYLQQDMMEMKAEIATLKEIYKQR